MTNRICILGGGITGLSTAWQLSKIVSSATEILVIEKRAELGGCIRTVRANLNEGLESKASEVLILEQGPHTIRTSGNLQYPLYELLASLNMQEQILKATSNSSIRYVAHKNQIVPLPHSISGFLFTSIGRKLLIAVLHDLKRFWRFPFSRRSLPDESVHQFASRQFGRQFANLFMSALVRGIYAGDAKLLSVRACFPFLVSWEEKYSSVTIGALLSFLGGKTRINDHQSDVEATRRLEGHMERSRPFSFKGGMFALVEALENYLLAQKNISVLKEHECTNIEYLPSESFYRLSFRNKQCQVKTFDVQKLVCSIPAHSLTKLLLPTSSTLHRLITLLASIKFCNLAVINVAFSSRVVLHKAFGFLVPSVGDESSLLGVIFHSQLFPAQCSSQHERLTLMMNVASNEHVYTRDLEQRALAQLKSYLPITEAPSFVKGRILKNCIPQYEVGHLEKIKLIFDLVTREFGENFILTGNSYFGVSVPHCMKEGVEAANKVI
ncbi:protoporphyrinogen oxidase-like [Zophobas morio]|uniref:protoporphyrinogen oxidase-like n=1 Tax=Zophobas morio TaxID=2755281 RepID=UPI00308364C2